MSRGGATPYASRRRRPKVLRWVFLALLIVPVVEIAAIIAVGRVIGGWQTLLLLVLESFLGAWIVKREGGRTWAAVERDAQRVYASQGWAGFPDVSAARKAAAKSAVFSTVTPKPPNALA